MRRYITNIRSGVKRGKEVLSRWFAHNPETLQPQPVRLKDYLFDVAKTERFAPEHLPSSIDLGEFGRETERLINLSIVDPKHPEYGSMVCIDRVGRVLMLRQPVRGEETSVTLPLPENKRRILTIHTHGETDTPFSSHDLQFLLIDPRDERAAAALILATPSLKMLITRTKRTPYLSEWEAFDASTDMDSHPAMGEEQELYDSHCQLAEGEGGERIPEPRGEELPLTVHWKQRLGQLSHKRMFVLIQTVQRYHLKLYSCPLEKNIVYPVT